jgi:hypothetical protein
MNKTDKISTTIAFIALVASIGSLGFIGLEVFFKSGFVKDFSVGVTGSVIGAAIALVVSRFFAKRKVPSVFVSYHYANKEIAKRIAKELEGISNHVWIDDSEIMVGDSIKEKIEAGLKNSDYFLILLSDESSKSPWVNAEVTKALSMGKLILPVKIDDSEAPELLKNIAYADLSTSFEKGIDRVKKTLIESSHNKAIQPTR